MTPEDEDFILEATRRMLEDVVFPEQDAVDAQGGASEGRRR